MALTFDEKGLLTAVVQDSHTKQVLMVAMMNAEALTRILESGLAHFWSRSRQAVWSKGETSGNFLTAKEMRINCGGDTVLLLVQQSVSPQAVEEEQRKRHR